MLNLFIHLLRHSTPYCPSQKQQTKFSNKDMWCFARFGNIFNLKNMKNTDGGVLLLVNLRASACNFTNRNAPPWVFFTFFKLYKSRNTPLCEQICKNSGWKTFYLLGHSFSTLHKYVCVRNQGVRNISFSDNFAHVPLCAVSHIVNNLPQNTNFRNNLKMQIIWNSNGRHKYGQLFDKKGRRV